MLRFTAQIQGEVIIDRAFNRVEQEITDFRNFWPGVITTFYEIENEQFLTEGASGASGKWAPLSPAYKLFKEREFPGKTILRREDALYESMTGPDALDSVLRPEKEELLIGSAVPYALFHQKSRPIISLTEEQKRRFMKSIQQRLVEFTRSTGFQVDERAA
jgi:phage gpG-like protein